MSGSFPPPGESAEDLWKEKSNFVGAVLGGVAYGIHVAVFTECFRSIYSLPSGKMSNRSRSWLLAFIFTLFIMGTINLGCNTKMNQLMFIDNRAYPGGPNAWFFAFYSHGVNTTGNTSYIIANFLTDGLLLWRTWVVYERKFWVIAFPSLMYLACTAMSIMVIFQSSRPNASLWTTTTVQFTLPYFTISISLNIILTLLLVGQLLRMSYDLRQTMGKEHAATYISIASMLLESAMPYAVVGLIFIITYVRNSDVQNLVLPVLSQIMCISPEIILLRVATGRAVDSKPTTTETRQEGTLRFRTQKSDFAGDTSLGLASFAPSGVTDQTGSATLGSRPDPEREVDVV